MISRRMALCMIGMGAAGCATSPFATEGDVGIDRVLDDYRLGAGDRVRVTVFREPSLTGEFQVSSAGMISMPLIGDLRAADLTVADFRRSVELALRGTYLLQPRVSAEVLTYRPFFILGEVGAPGTYPYTADLTVLNAVATAGGFTYRAATDRVYIRRANASVEEVFGLTTRTSVAPGDTIRIGERRF